nr:DinB family protein [Saprospiraceae bacterium]
MTPLHLLLVSLLSLLPGLSAHHQCQYLDAVQPVDIQMDLKIKPSVTPMSTHTLKGPFYLKSAHEVANLPSIVQKKNKPMAIHQTENRNEEKLLKNYASYNRWANEQFVKWLSGASEEQFYREVESSFNSLEKTLLHLWNAEYGWLQTLKGNPWGDPPGRDFEGSMEELFEGFLSTSVEFENFVHQMSEEELAGYRTLGRDGKATAVEGIILHVFNHATYHRGQLITMGRQVGLSDPPRSDYIYYIRL